MNAQPSPPDPRRHDPARRGTLARRSSILTAGVLLTVLLLVWGGGIYALRVISQSKERELELRLQAIGRIEVHYLAEQVNLDLLSLAIPEQLTTEEGAAETAATHFLDLYQEYLESALQTLVERGQLRRAMLVDIHRRAIIDSAEQAEPFVPYEFLDIDQFEIRRATESDQSVATPYYSVQDEPYKRSYTPIQDSSGRVIALLQLEASRGYFAEMEKLRPQLVSLMTVVTVLVLLVGLLFHRLLLYALKAESAATEADRLQAVSTLAAGFAHEVRNPLGIIRSYAESMAEELGPERGEFNEMATEMVEEVVRVDDLISQFINFARPEGAASWQKVNISEILTGVVRLVRKELESKQLQTQLNINANLPPVWADERSLRQVFLNVLLNARDACQPGGMIRIEAQDRRDRIIIRFEDTGRGIPSNEVERVFEPFFTTKSNGTGLGLSISRGIIEQFGGKISIRSSVGRGTTVEIALPLSEQ